LMEVSVEFAASAWPNLVQTTGVSAWHERLPITNTPESLNLHPTLRRMSSATRHAASVIAVLRFAPQDGRPPIEAGTFSSPASCKYFATSSQALDWRPDRDNIPRVLSFRVWGRPSSVGILRSCSSFIPRNRAMGTCQYQPCFTPGLLEVCGIPRAYRLCLDVKRLTGLVASIGTVPLLL
jgi:hypothetical protein